MTARRATWQRWLGARYDGAHAMLVRLVHPSAFGALVLTIGMLVIPATQLAVAVFDADGFAALFVVIIAAIGIILTAFRFVLTLRRGLVVLALVAGWSLLLLSDVAPRGGMLDAVWGIAAASIVLQVVLLARVVPARARAGLLHLLPAATVGTVAGAVPVWFGLRAALADRDDESRQLLLLMFAAATIVTLVLLAMHGLVRWRDRAVVAEFASRHGMKRRQAGHVPEPVAALVSSFVDAPRFFHGRFGGHAVAVGTGFTLGTEPDVPSLHLTVLGMRLEHDGPDLWVRRRDVSHDNLLVGTDHAGVLRFESISFDERWSVRFDAGTDLLTSYEAFGPQLIDLLDRSLGDGQVCRIGRFACAWIVGGACSADELDALATTLDEFGDLLEGPEVRRTDERRTPVR